VNSYNPGLGQSYYPQNQVPLPQTLPTGPVGVNSYNPGLGQSYYPQNQVPLPQTLPTGPVGVNSYNPGLGQSYYQQPNQVPLPNAVNPNFSPAGTAVLGQVSPPSPTSVTQLGQVSPAQDPSLFGSKPLNSPSLQFQGTYVLQGDESVARARLAGLYPLSSRALFGATVDLTSEASGLADSPGEGLNLNELYFSTAPIANLPNLRFVVGQLDLTSYFDRNSFAKDGVSHFFNPVFQTNPALSATGISSRPGALVNWTLNDNLEAKAAFFSSSPDLGDFSLDGFAGEVGFRFGNAIIRGTYATGRDAGSDTGFQEIFSVSRGDDDFGLESGDRETAFGVNAEVFVPELNMGIFGRYGHYENQDLDEGGNTYSLGVSFLDVFTQNDRLGLAYGRGLSNEKIREQNDDDIPDVLELFYDLRVARNFRLGFTLQQRDGFSETYAGFRVKTEFDIIPQRRLAP
ncbi:MAG: carbohydrate porin, partial [Coleofasciculaceae cyanobacterium]